MLLGILSIIALGVGVFESADNTSQVDQLALQETRSAIVQVVDAPEPPTSRSSDLGF